MVRCSDANSLPELGLCYVFAVGRSNGSPFDAFNLPNESIPQAGRSSGSAFSERESVRLPARTVQVLTKTWGGMNQDFAAPAGSNQDFENKLFGCPLERSDVPLQQFFRWPLSRRGHTAP